MRARAVAIVAALGVLVALALPGGAAAKPDFYRIKAYSTEQFQMRAANGYRLSLSVVNRRANVDFYRSTGHGGDQFVGYAIRRRISRGPGLHFRLGSEAAFDLRFVPRKTKAEEYSSCEGGPEVVERGRFVGTIRFSGRGGFTRADAHHVNGTVTRTPPQTCRRERSPAGVDSVGISTGGTSPLPKGALELIAGTTDRRLHFDAFRFDKPGFPEPLFQNFDASIYRSTPGFSMSSVATVAGAAHDFLGPEPGEPLKAVTVSPPAPFTGSATFKMTSSRRAEWSGDLTVELPGYGRVPLTGPSVRAGLCEGKTCTPTLPKSLRPPTGSGEGRFKVSYFNGG
jgi:hypothetical protein